MKIWQKKDGSGSNDMVEKFTVGRDKEFDIMLAEYDVIGSIAHVKMLESVGLLSENDLILILRGLEEIKSDIRNGNFTIEDGPEDIH